METTQKQFTIRRIINAPQQLVWDMLTKPEHLKNWWGPAATEIGYATVDLRPGGMFHYSMVAPDGNTMWGKFVYTEIDEPNKLVYKSSFSDAEGEITPIPFPGMVFPLEILNILTLTEEGGKTVLTITGHPVNATAEEEAGYYGLTENMQQGFGGTFDKLDNYLSTL